MINKGSVSLRQAREDCGISGSGRMKNVTEFVDRHEGSGYTLKQLGGHVIGFSSKVVTGYYRKNSNPGGACRKNWAEENCWSAQGSHVITLSNSGVMQAESSSGDEKNQSLGGWSFVGTVPPGTSTYQYKYAFRGKATGSQMAVELIGWPSGYFVGTPEYYANYVTGAEQSPRWLDVQINGTATPYLTMCIQSVGTNYLSRMEVYTAAMRKK